MPRLLQLARLKTLTSSSYISRFFGGNQAAIYNKYYDSIKDRRIAFTSRLFCSQFLNSYEDWTVANSKHCPRLLSGHCQDASLRYQALSVGVMSAAFSTSGEHCRHNGDSLNISNIETITTTSESAQTKKSDRIIWVDLEMTGLDFVSDRILEIACLVTEADLEVVAQGPHIIVHESDEVLNNMEEWCKEHHGKSGLTESVRHSKISLREAEEMLLDFVRKHTPKGACPLAGNTIGMDRSFILCHMPQFAEHLHHRVVDVSTVKELCRRWYPDQFQMAPVKQDKHRSIDDILESITELKFYRSTIFK